MPSYSADVLCDQTGRNLGSSSARWNLFAQNLDISGTTTFSGTWNPKVLEDIAFADQFPGASVTAKIDNALANAGTLLVVIPSSMGAGNPTSVNSGKCILDLRSGVPKFFTSASPSTASWTMNNDGTVSSTFKSTTANPSGTGQIRLANADAIKSRNASNSADLNLINMNSSNVAVVGDSGGVSIAGTLALAGGITGLTNLTMTGTLTTAAIASSGQITSSLATGTAPFSITSTTVVPNLNVQNLNGVTVSGSPSANQVLQASSSTAAAWATLTTGAFSILNKQDASGALTGNSADQTIYTYSMPSATLAASKGVRITCYTSHSSGTATVGYKVFFGATSASLTGALNHTFVSHQAMVFNNTGSTTAQWMGYQITGTNSALTAATTAAPAENTNSGSAIVIKITFNVANTDQVTPKGFLVELIA